MASFPVAFTGDLFVDANGTLLSAHTGDKAATWTANSNGTYSAGTFTINTNRAWCSAGPALFYPSAAPTLSEYDVYGLVNFTSLTGITGVAARVSPTADTCYLGVYDSSATAWRIYKRVAGTQTQIATGGTGLPAVGNTKTLRLGVRITAGGLALTLWVNGTNVASGNDLSAPISTVTGPNVGIYSSATASTSTGLQFAGFGAWDVSTVKATGNWSNTATWTSGVVPNDLVTIENAIAATVTIDQNIGTTGNGIGNIRQMHASAQFKLNAPASPYVIKFASNGNSPQGTIGTFGDPGPDATMYGIIAAAGNLNLDGTGGSQCIFTSQDDASPIYMVHLYATLSLSVGCLLTLKNCDARHLGVSAPGGFEGIKWQSSDANSTVVIDKNKFTDAFNVFQIAVGVTSPVTITNNWMTGARGDGIVSKAAVGTQSWTITDNTEDAPAVTGTSFTSFLSNPTGLVWRDNWIYSADATKRRTGLTLSGNASGTGGNTLNSNYVGNTPPVSGSVSSGTGFFLGLLDATTTVSGNVIDYPYQGVGCQGSTGAYTISNNFIRQANDCFNGQGAIIISKGAITTQNNVIIFDLKNNGAGGNFGIFNYSTFTTGCKHFHNTIHDIAGIMAAGIVVGEGGVGNNSTGNKARDSLVFSGVANTSATGPNAGIADWHASNTWSADTGLSGSHHNCVSVTVSQYVTLSGNSSGFNDGTNAHPNAVYGDLSVNPGLRDTTRTTGSWDASLGGPGTIANATAIMRGRSGFGGVAYNPAYTVANLNAYLMAGWAPTNPAVKGAASDGTVLGAVPYRPAVSRRTYSRRLLARGA